MRVTEVRVDLGTDDYLLPPAELASRLASFFVDGKEILIERFVRGAVNELLQPLTPTLKSAEEWRDGRLTPILDALTTVAFEAIDYRCTGLIEPIHEILYQIYERAYSRQGFGQIALPAALISIEVIKRVYLIGSALLERRHYAAAAQLINQPITWDRYDFDRLWSRHALTEYANSGQNGRAIEAQLVGWALRELARQPWFLRRFGDQHRATDLLCQLDYLQCIHVAHRTKDFRAAYPSFCHYRNDHTEPLIVVLVSDPGVRSQSIPSMDKSEFAETIRAFDVLAANIRRSSVQPNRGWMNNVWSDLRIRQFLDARPPQGTS